MITNDIKLDDGQIFLNGYDMARNRSKVNGKIGYCPQFDALLEYLSAEEHLHLFCGIKGYSQRLRNKIIDYKLKELDLIKYRDVPSMDLSGGNKRKLSSAIATLGKTSFQFFIDQF